MVSKVIKNILSTSSSLQEETGKYRRRAGPPKDKTINKTDKRRTFEKDSDYEKEDTDSEGSSEDTIYNDKNASSEETEGTGKEKGSEYNRQGSDTDERTDDDEYTKSTEWTEIKAKRGKQRTNRTYDSNNSGKSSDGQKKGNADETTEVLIRKAEAIESAIKESGNMKREAKKYILKILEGTQ